MNARRTPPAPWQPRPQLVVRHSPFTTPCRLRASRSPPTRTRTSRDLAGTGPRPAASSGRLVGRLVRPALARQRVRRSEWESMPTRPSQRRRPERAVSGYQLVPGPSRRNDTAFTTLALLDARRVCVHRDLAQAVPTVGFALDAVAALHKAPGRGESTRTPKRPGSSCVRRRSGSRASPECSTPWRSCRYGSELSPGGSSRPTTTNGCWPSTRWRWPQAMREREDEDDRHHRGSGARGRPPARRRRRSRSSDQDDQGRGRRCPRRR